MNLVEVPACRRVGGEFSHLVRMTVAERGGRAVLRVLAKSAKVVDVNISQGGSDVLATGKVICSAVCEIAGGEVVNIEHAGGFSFSHRAICAPSVCSGVALVSDVRVVRASGCEVCLEVEFALQEEHIKRETFSLVSGGDGIYSEARRGGATVWERKAHSFVCGHEFVVPCEVKAVVSADFFVENGGVSLAGELETGCTLHGVIAFLDGEGGLGCEKVSWQVKEMFSPCEGGMFAVRQVAGASAVAVSVDEVKGESAVRCEVEVLCEVCGFADSQFEYGVNFFSCKTELICEAGEVVSTEYCGAVRGEGRFSEVVDWQYDSPASVSIAGVRVCGVSCGADGKAVCVLDVAVGAGKGAGEIRVSDFKVACDVEMSLPRRADAVSCDVAVADIGARLSGGGGVEVFGRVICSGQAYCDVRVDGFASVAVGEEKPEVRRGFVVLACDGGESVVDVCKQIGGVMPWDVMAQNERVKFPCERGERIVVRR